MRAHHTVHFPSAQKGAALVVSMVMLLVITVIGVAVMGGSRLEWLMANNSHLQTDAYRNAEIALNAGLSSMTNPPVSLPSPPSPVITLPLQDLIDVNRWSDGTIASIPVATPTGSAAYFVEYLGCGEYQPIAAHLSFINNNCTDLPATAFVFAYVYRVWALGTDGKGAARILQTTHTLINNQAPVAGLPNWTPGMPAPNPLPPLNNRAELPSS